MKSSKHLLLACMICASLSFASLKAYAIDEEKKQVIKELLDVSGSDKIATIMGQASSQQILSVIKAQNPETPQKVFDIIDEEVMKLFEEEIASGSFHEMIYPIYDEKFTAEELKEVIKFYKTPVGAKVLKELPDITQKAMVAGQSWGLSLSPKIQSRVRDRLKAEGLE